MNDAYARVSYPPGRIVRVVDPKDMKLTVFKKYVIALGSTRSAQIVLIMDDDNNRIEVSVDQLATVDWPEIP